MTEEIPQNKLKVGDIICFKPSPTYGNKYPETITGKIVKIDNPKTIWIIAKGELFCTIADKCWFPKNNEKG